MYLTGTLVLTLLRRFSLAVPSSVIASVDSLLRSLSGARCCTLVVGARGVSSLSPVEAGDSVTVGVVS